MNPPSPPPSAQPTHLFTLQIPPYNSASAPSPNGGTITLHSLPHPYSKVYILTFTSPPDNRLTPPFLTTFLLALSILEHHPSLPPGILLTTSGIPKFYSNGLDFAAISSTPNDRTFFARYLYPFWRKLLTFPMPTVAVINGHAFAGGLMTAMAHDYRIMNPHRGYVCLNELDFNASLSPGMSSLFKHKITMSAFRNVVLEARRFNALAALEAGLVDGVGGVDEAVKILCEDPSSSSGAATQKPLPPGRSAVNNFLNSNLPTTPPPQAPMTRMTNGIGSRPMPPPPPPTPVVGGLVGKMSSKSKGESSYGLIKEEMYREIIADLDRDAGSEVAFLGGKKEDRERRAAEERRMVEEWAASNGVAMGRSKL